MKKFVITIILLASTIFVFSQKRVVRSKTIEEKLNEQYCSALFRTPDGTYFDMLNDNTALSAKSYLNILDWLQGRVSGLQVYTLRNNERLALIRNSIAGIYVDEVYRDPGYLNLLPVSDIAMIKIIKGPFLGGFNNPGGAIAIYTVGSDDEDDDE